jgi:molybdopterin converting factor subunit 1
VHVTVRLFARLREIVGAGELAREVPEGGTARSAWDALVAEFPGLGPYATSISVAVNEEYARLTTAVKDGDEVAFLPPVSGGAADGGPEGPPYETHGADRWRP